MTQVFGLRHQRRGLARRSVRQAQEGDVGRIEQARALGAVLAALGVDAQHLDVAARGEHLVDAQARGAVLAVDEDLRCHGVPLAHNAFKGFEDKARR